MTKNIIHGVCPSKSNCYRIIRVGEKARFAKTAALNKYENSFFIQCQERGRLLEGYFEFHVDVYYPSERADLDNSLKVLLDCLQYCKVIKNDNKVVKIVANKFKDKERPRIEYFINPINT